MPAASSNPVPSAECLVPDREDAFMSTSTETIEQLASREYKYGFETELETDTFPPGLDEEVDSPAVGDQGRAGVAARVPAQVVSRLARDEGADVAQPEDRADRLPRDQLLLGAEEEAAAREHGRGRSRGPQDVREARDSARGAEAARRRGGRRGVRQRLGGDDVPRQAGGARHHLLLVLGSGEGPSRARQEVSRLGRAVHRQLLRHAQLGGLQRRLVRLRAEGRPLPDGAVDVLPHQRQEHRAVRAHADRRRRGIAP